MNNNPGTFNKILNSINSTLNIANKVVPIYKEAKPIINTVTSTYKKVKDNGNDIKKVIKLMKFKNEIKKEQNINTNNFQNTYNQTITTNNSNINNPKFFI